MCFDIWATKSKLFVFLANCVPKCQMSSGRYKPIFTGCHNYTHSFSSRQVANTKTRSSYGKHLHKKAKPFFIFPHNRWYSAVSLDCDR